MPRAGAHRLLCPWNSPGKNTGMGCHFLLQGIFLTQDQTRISWVFCIGHQVIYHLHLSLAPPGKPSHSLRSLKLKYSSELYVDMACSLSCCYYSVTKSCPTLCDPINCSTSGFPVLHCLPEFAQTHVHWVSGDIQSSILCYPLLLPSIFPSIRVFSNESVLSIRWPEYWSFSFSISSSSEYSRLISFRIDWLDLLAAQGTINILIY